MPVAQLIPASGTIYTANPSEAFARLRGVPVTSLKGPATPPAKVTSLVSPPATPSKTGFNGPPPDQVVVDDSWGSMAPLTPTQHKLSTGPGGSASEGAQSPSESFSGPPHEHPLVLSGRRVWIVSPVVGWASVYAETGQKILELEVEGRREGKGEGADGEGSGGPGGSRGNAFITKYKAMHKKGSAIQANPLLNAMASTITAGAALAGAGAGAGKKLVADAGKAAGGGGQSNGGVGGGKSQDVEAVEGGVYAELNKVRVVELPSGARVQGDVM